MTCIVGITHEGSVWMGGDACGSAYSPGWLGAQKLVSSLPKVFVRDALLFGYSSSFRMGDLLRYRMEIPANSIPESGPHEYVSCSLIAAIRKCFAEGGYGKIKDGRDEEGGYFLVGYRGHLFTVQSDFSVTEDVCGYAAVGSGAEVAMGAFYVSQDDRSWSPESRIKLALSAAETHCTGVQSPFTIVELPPTRKELP